MWTVVAISLEENYVKITDGETEIKLTLEELRDITGLLVRYIRENYMATT